MSERASKNAPRISVKKSLTKPNPNTSFESPTAESHHKHNHAIAIIVSLILAAPLILGIILQTINYNRKSPKVIYSKQESNPPLTVSLSNNKTLQLTSDSLKNNTDCLYIPSTMSKKIIESFSSYSSIYNKNFISIRPDKEKPFDRSYQINIPENMEEYCLICREVTTTKDGDFEILTPKIVKTFLIATKPLQSTTKDLTLYTKNNCLILNGSKPINQDLICSPNLSKSENGENKETPKFTESASINDSYIYALGKVTQETHFNSFETAKCFKEEIKFDEIVCTMRISFNLTEYEKKDFPIKSVYLKESQLITVKIDNTGIKKEEISILDCDKENKLNEKEKENLLELENLNGLETLKCKDKTVNIENLKYLSKLVGFLKNDKNWKGLNGEKLEKMCSHFIHVLRSQEKVEGVGEGFPGKFVNGSLNK